MTLNNSDVIDRSEPSFFDSSKELNPTDQPRPTVTVAVWPSYSSRGQPPGSTVLYPRVSMDIVRLATTSALVGLIVAGGVSSCGFGSGTAGLDDARPTTVDVYAASSLTDVYSEIEQRFEDANPDIDIRLNLAGSSTLARQINDGAPADVFAPADLSILDQLEPNIIQASVTPPEPYAKNRLVLVVPAGNPQSIEQLIRLEQSDILTAKCISGVPCGDATDRGLASAGIELGLVTEETNVRSVLAKVVAGEVDAGFVYQTDAKVAAEVNVVEGFDSPAVQLVAIDLNASRPPDSARSSSVESKEASARFVSYIGSEQAETILTSAGFEQP